ncbi:response regulator [Ruegeria sp. HKCCSP351]|uniref:response regulator n=1 Tax=Ruegeria sp. HKCCSP351 TaxID=2794832 RepID=UPI001AE58A2A|nr:response regulator [Ruegeria sp. HKCCSP351]
MLLKLAPNPLEQKVFAMSLLKRVVHVDDDEDILTITRMSLELVGDFEVTQFSSAKDALNNLKSLQPDLFLLDVMMPDMDGPELLCELRKRPEFRDTPVVFMTAKAESSIQNTPISESALAYITKPFDPFALPKQLKSLLENGL